MKQLLLPILLLTLAATAQEEKKLRAPIEKVTVFLSGAQVEHQLQTTLSTGKQIVVFQQLTDFVDPASVQLKCSDNATILSVRTRKNFDETAIAKDEVTTLNEKRRKIEIEERKYRDEYTVLLHDEQLLLQNSDLGSQQQAVKIAELKEASTFFHSRLAEIRNRKSQLEDLIEARIREINSIEQEINTRRSLPVKNYTELEVELSVEKAGTTHFIFSYITPQASWKPYYDMRSAGVGSTMQLEARGIVTQSTGENWTNVELILSTNDPYDNTQEPTIEPWYLNYNTPLPQRNRPTGTVFTQSYEGQTIFGEVIDATTGESLPFAQIRFSTGSNPIATTDIDGRFSCMLPKGEKGFTVSYMGYRQQYVPVQGPFTKIMLEPELAELEEVVIVADSYKSNRRDRLAKKRQEERYLSQNAVVTAQQIQNSPVATSTTKDLRMEFRINMPFSIPSDNADHRVAIATYEMPASYEYHTVPKLDPSVYLVAQISGWEKLNLLSGESNLYFDGTFIGKSYLQTNSVKDTLSFSLGKDRKLVVERKRSEEKSKKRAIGNRTRYEVQWDFTLRNNGKAAVPVIIKDHFPIPVNEDIKVKQGEFPGATLDEKTGILTWRFLPGSGESKNFFFFYSVEYSNNLPLYLE